MIYRVDARWTANQKPKRNTHFSYRILTFPWALQTTDIPTDQISYREDGHYGGGSSQNIMPSVYYNKVNIVFLKIYIILHSITNRPTECVNCILDVHCWKKLYTFQPSIPKYFPPKTFGIYVGIIEKHHKLVCEIK